MRNAFPEQLRKDDMSPMLLRNGSLIFKLHFREPSGGQLKKSRGSLPIIGAHITPRSVFFRAITSALYYVMNDNNVTISVMRMDLDLQFLHQTKSFIN